MNRVKFEFARYGVAYHVAASALSELAVSAVVGNLAHHAAEMYLKAFLADHLPTRRGDETSENGPSLERLGHSLPRLWREFVSRHDVVPDGYFEFVTTLHAFEEIRYPDWVETTGMQLEIARRGGVVLGPSVPVPTHYGLAISDLDRFAHLLFLASGLNPAAFGLFLLPGGEKHWFMSRGLGESAA